MPAIERTDRCPCESGKLARACCLSRYRAQKVEADTRPRGQRTGFAHPDCYATALNDCSVTITGEHFWSETILRELSGGTVVVRGFPWQTTPTQRIGVGALAPKVLCDRHNEALSPLDVEAGRFFRNLRTIEGELRGQLGTRRVVLFAGVDVERWFLKALMGAASGGAARLLDGTPIAWSPPSLWSRILFHRAGFPKTWGLYVKGRVGDRVMLDPREVSLAPLMTDDGVSGCVATVAGFEFVLAMCDVGPRRAGALDDHAVHHPDELFFLDEPSRTEQSLCFTWPKVRGGGQVTFNWSR